MIFIPCYYLVSFKWVLFDDFHSMLLSSLLLVWSKEKMKQMRAWDSFSFFAKYFWVIFQFNTLWSNEPSKYKGSNSYQFIFYIIFLEMIVCVCCCSFFFVWQLFFVERDVYCYFTLRRCRYKGNNKI